MNNSTVHQPVGSGLVWLPEVLVTLVTTLCSGGLLLLMIRLQFQKLRHNTCLFVLVSCEAAKGLFMFVYALSRVADPGHARQEDACYAWSVWQTWLYSVCCSSHVIFMYDRLMFIQSPVNYRHRVTPHHLAVMVVYLVAHGFIIAMLPVLGLGRYGFLARPPLCDVTWPGAGYQTLLLFWSYILPSCGGAILYCRLRWFVRKRVSKVSVFGRRRTRLVPRYLNRELHKLAVEDVDEVFANTLQTATLLLCLQLATWAPHALAAVLFMAGVHGDHTRTGLYILTRLLIATPSYSLTLTYLHPLLRRALSSLVRQRRLDTVTMVAELQDTEPSSQQTVGAQYTNVTFRAEEDPPAEARRPPAAEAGRDSTRTDLVWDIDKPFVFVDTSFAQPSDVTVSLPENTAASRA